MATMQEIQAELATIKAENERLKASQTRRITLKMAEKGGLSVYGMGKFPVTLYAQQWETLLGLASQIKDFCAANAAEMTRRSDLAREARKVAATTPAS